MSLLFLRTIISKLRRKIYDISIKYGIHLSFRVFLKEGLANSIGEMSIEMAIMVELIRNRERERGREEVETSKIHGSSTRNDCDVYAAHRNGARGT